MTEMSVAERIRRKLEARLSPSRLQVVDESHLHVGHAGARPGGESHFRVEAVSEAFAGQSRVARQRMVHEALAEELAGPVHALSLRLMAPDEAAARPE